MSDDGIEFANLDQFLQNIEYAANQAPATAEKYLKKAGNKLRKAAKDASPESHDQKKKSKHLKNRWSGKIKGMFGHDLEYDLRSKAPHYHLVERGHAKVTPNGRVVGFTPGTHFFEKAVQQFQSSGEVDKQLEKFFEEFKNQVEGGH
ncbi:hypothetical protein SELR_pSRC500260 (plasmid) [Selenomonas ruminantium subsp. lactilytica TAM6421]|uniref:Uncharacterized protein n=1 Tax=Selenomonas ruminantium subsp. lactilytica (strain NBRC 103574 / TAM6421) TaxID=927704 RepID=I0GWR3_SELRL|nr:HK97 gp10 family phage protein [Selenomonas ruminantium]BAL85200.1 hypothetical protein SELR_pSRC500260 [Selenomonas ruminantium subsp. lactilytica TAM6421]